VTPDATAAYSLLSAEAVRDRAERMLAIGLDDRLPNFRIDLQRLDAATDLVQATTLRRYPTLDIPFHSRWRHFVINGEDRWAAAVRSKTWSPGERARAEFDLAIVSVLLDAGAGTRWRYRDPVTGTSVGRSEGLALASLAMFLGGAFSSNPDEPLRADGAALAQLSLEQLRAGFQLSDSNPLDGIEGRRDLLRALGDTVVATPMIFGINDAPRPGGLFDHLAAHADKGSIAAPAILVALLDKLKSIWPSRLSLGGIPLGDCWRHSSITVGDATDGLVPLHKLSQWLAYSLIEPLQTAGISVTDIDGLTGLAEYRNGGLFVDTGVLAFRDPSDAGRDHDVASELVVEWRALTVALLDHLAQRLRRRLALDVTSLPLVKVLEGGSWAAGRSIARERRADGSPPIKVVSDGTVF
jgi:hypothetical protein